MAFCERSAGEINGGVFAVPKKEPMPIVDCVRIETDDLVAVVDSVSLRPECPPSGGKVYRGKLIVVNSKAMRERKRRRIVNPDDNPVIVDIEDVRAESRQRQRIRMSDRFELSVVQPISVRSSACIRKLTYDVAIRVDSKSRRAQSGSDFVRNACRLNSARNVN